MNTKNDLKPICDLRHPKTMKNLQALEKMLGYSFKNKELLRNALIHSSFVNESKLDSIESNERMEFLGDSVLSLSISTYIYENYHYHEGDCTKLRALVVCEQALARVANHLGLGEYIFFGKGEEQTGGRERDCILADATEALIAAIYLDSDFQTVFQFIIRNFEEIIVESNSGSLDRDYKSKLQEKLQERGTQIVKYEIFDEHGPAHNKQYFANAVYMDKVIGTGQGKSKKIAQKAAAEDAYKNMFGKEG